MPGAVGNAAAVCIGAAGAVGTVGAGGAVATPGIAGVGSPVGGKAVDVGSTVGAGAGAVSCPGAKAADATGTV